MLGGNQCLKRQDDAGSAGRTLASSRPTLHFADPSTILLAHLQAAEAASAAAAEEARGQLTAAQASYDAVLGGLRQQEAELLERVAELSRQVSRGQDHSTRSAAELDAATAALEAAQQKLAAAEADATAHMQQAEALQAEVRAAVKLWMSKRACAG